MAPRTPLGTANTNVHIQKKSKTSKLELSPHKRSMIEGLHKAGCSMQAISKIENTPYSTVRDTLKLLPVRPKGYSLLRSGRTPILNKVEKRAIIRFVRENVKASYLEVKQKLQLSCSISTIRRIVRKMGIKKWLAKKRPVLIKEVVRACLAWCRERKNWSTEQWQACIWSDECSVELGSGKQPEYCFRTPHQKWEKEMIQTYNKGKACTVMVWAAFCAGRRLQLVFMPGDPEAKKGGVTSAVYLEILENELPTIWEPGLVFIQDNASIHTARLVKNWLKEEGIEVLEWPPYSPDLNPIEHAWKRLKQWVWKHHPELLELKGKGQNTKEAMLKALQEGWDAIEEEFFEKLIASMQRRVRAVCKAKGWYTKY